MRRPAVVGALADELQRRSRDDVGRAIEDMTVAAAVPEALSPPRPLDQDPPHGFSGCPEEVRSVLEAKLGPSLAGPAIRIQAS